MRLLAVLASCVTTAPIPTPVGFGPRYRLPAVTARVAAGKPIGGLACTTAAPAVQSHVELFADEKVLIIPAGVGRPRRGCRYPVSTQAPTGVVDSLGGQTLGDLFAVWGQPLSAHRLAGFRGAVHVWVGGCARRGDVRTLRLTQHAEIVVEVGGYVPPHRFFLFPRR